MYSVVVGSQCDGWKTRRDWGRCAGQGVHYTGGSCLTGMSYISDTSVACLIGISCTYLTQIQQVPTFADI